MQTSQSILPPYLTFTHHANTFPDLNHLTPWYHTTSDHFESPKLAVLFKLASPTLFILLCLAFPVESPQ